MRDAPRANYEEIAARYDEDRRNWEIPPDDVVTSLLVSGPESICVLDVGCGTGTYLEIQRGHFSSRFIHWFGIDPSGAMLDVARTKLPIAVVARARAERLPFSSEAFHYVYSSFAFHHFENKASALDEMARVLMPGGRLRIRNMDPWRIERSWGYVFFPETRQLDELRFWPASKLGSEVERRGFRVEFAFEDSTELLLAADVLARAERRAISQLAILDDDAYGAGLERLRKTVAERPDATIESEFARLVLTATKADDG